MSFGAKTGLYTIFDVIPFAIRRLNDWRACKWVTTAFNSRGAIAISAMKWGNCTSADAHTVLCFEVEKCGVTAPPIVLMRCKHGKTGLIIHWNNKFIFKLPKSKPFWTEWLENIEQRLHAFAQKNSAPAQQPQLSCSPHFHSKIFNGKFHHSEILNGKFFNRILIKSREYSMRIWNLEYLDTPT